MKTDIDKILDEIEAREKAATEGPWLRGEISERSVYAVPDITDKAGDCIVLMDSAGAKLSKSSVQANSVFIAAARNDVPALVKALRKLIKDVCPGSRYLNVKQAAAIKDDIASILSGKPK